MLLPLNLLLLWTTGEGTGLLRLHSTYRHDLKIYSSDEGRVQVSSLLLLNNYLVILVSEFLSICFQFFFLVGLSIFLIHVLGYLFCPLMLSLHYACYVGRCLPLHSPKVYLTWKDNWHQSWFVCCYKGMLVELDSYNWDDWSMCFLLHLKVSLVSKDSSMLDGLDNASIEMEDAKVFFSLHCVQIYKHIVILPFSDT